MLRYIRRKIRDRLFKLVEQVLNGEKEAFLEERMTYLLHEVSETRQHLRMLLGESPRFQAWTAQTRASFDTQWHILPEGDHLATDPSFLQRGSKLVEEYTQLPASWFKGKTLLDAGCGNGRWAYVFCRLGAKVTAVDQSDHGIENVRRLCSEFPDFRAQAANLLEPLALTTSFDFVWSFGVLHHTGDTRRSFDNVQKMVKPGGKLLLMIYGEPERQGEFDEINTYVKHRRATSAMTFPEKVEYLRDLYPTELVHGYFDAISPAINDLHRFDEIREWLVSSGFGDVKRTFDNRNLIIMAIRKSSPISRRVTHDLHADRPTSN